MSGSMNRPPTASWSSGSSLHRISRRSRPLSPDESFFQSRPAPRTSAGAARYELAVHGHPFGFVIRELFLRLQNWTQLDGAVRLHLVVGTILVLGSWIGFRRSLHRSGYQVKFFNLPLFRFLLDQMMLILYFRIAVLTDVGMTQSPAASDLAKNTHRLVLFIFVLYVVWDSLGMWMAKAKTTGADRKKKPLYPVVVESKMTDDEQAINWVGFLITAGGLLALLGLWLLADWMTPNYLFLTTATFLLIYRWAKDLRTSCQSR